MHDTVPAEVARHDLFAAVAPFVEAAAARLPQIPATEKLEAAVVVQSQPTVARLILTGPSSSLEVVRMVEPELPGHVALTEAAAQFIGAGLSACPPEVVDGVMLHAGKPGAGLIILLDLADMSAACLLAVSGVDLSRAQRLFSVEGSTSANAGESPATMKYTAH
jgi:hypothetical protein